MFGAVAAGAAAGGYDSIVDASRSMAPQSREQFRPDPAASAVYEELYREYVRLHDLFGRGGDGVMKNLRSIRASVEGRRRHRE
jgi:L-ribulokinase